MDRTIGQQKTELLEMNLDYDGGQTLSEAVRWSKFLSIVGIVGVGLLLLMVLIAGPFLVIVIICLLLLVIYTSLMAAPAYR